jgi:exopolyphosphatase/guanosine-5'-triphosphate,3'-diphosphate pyrophosphatase
VVASVSLQLGCVRLTERHLASDPPSDDEVATARRTVDEQLALADASLAEHDVEVAAAASLVAVAGTATTLGALHLGLDTYEETAIHGVRVPADALRELATRLVAMPAAERARLGPMQPGREDVIHGGALVLDAVTTRYGFAEVVVSEADNLDGLAASLA